MDLPKVPIRHHFIADIFEACLTHVNCHISKMRHDMGETSISPEKIDMIEEKEDISKGRSLYDVSKIVEMQMHILCLSYCNLIGQQWRYITLWNNQTTEFYLSMYLIFFVNKCSIIPTEYLWDMTHLVIWDLSRKRCETSHISSQLEIRQAWDKRQFFYL